MWTRTEDCFCHEQVRPTRAPNSSCAQRSSSSAVMRSKSSSGRGGAAVKQHLLDRVGPEPEAKRLERDHFLGWNVAEVDVWAELLDEPRLRRFRRRLEEDVLDIDRVHDLVHQPCAHLTGRPEDAGSTPLASFGDDLPGTGIELLAHPLDPEVGGDIHLRVLRTDLGQNTEVAREVDDQLQFSLARDLDGA